MCSSMTLGRTVSEKNGSDCSFGHDPNCHQNDFSLHGHGERSWSPTWAPHIHALLLQCGAFPHQTVAPSVLAREAIDFESVARTVTRFTITHFRQVTLMSHCSAYLPGLSNLQENRNREKAFVHLLCPNTSNEHKSYFPFVLFLSVILVQFISVLCTLKWCLISLLLMLDNT